MVDIPVKCRICYNCNREEKYCMWEYDEGEPKLPFEEYCDEFKFEPLFLVDLLEAMMTNG